MSDVQRTAALAARGKTRIKQQGWRGLTDVTMDEIRAMAAICDFFMEDYVGPLSKGEPELLPTNPQADAPSAPQQIQSS